MAEGKKSFVLYADLLTVVEKLMAKDEKDGTNDTGQLFLTILEYVNDRHPEPKNFIVEMAFEPVRLQLKRDLQRYEQTRERRSESGKLGGRPTKQMKAKKANAFSEKQMKAKKAVNVTVTVNDNVLSKDNNIIHADAKLSKREDAFKLSISPHVEKYGRDMCNDFYLYWTEPNTTKTKLRFEMQRTWDVARRLATWAKNNKQYGKDTKRGTTDDELLDNIRQGIARGVAENGRD